MLTRTHGGAVSNNAAFDLPSVPGSVPAARRVVTQLGEWGRGEVADDAALEGLKARLSALQSSPAQAVLSWPSPSLSFVAKSVARSCFGAFAAAGLS